MIFKIQIIKVLICPNYNVLFLIIYLLNYTIVII